ncbi:TadE-like protein [Variibacter gotjawalensis]|uniref:TadE-like protein n=2 Tax=Variibacter gotjawalensis TaxID=1333996 RepID=A0A0S3PPH6_9BRAD|nr:Flp pilus assembly protein TadG [Variibacter gotjawalensis]BAT57817.1 TadE-like protein [Variibacter gotjawalensis]
MLKFFARCEDGATAVEFSFIAVPFFALIFAIFELAFIFFGTQMLETATADAAREILTGNQQKKDKEKKPDGTDKTPAEKFAAFKKSVCDPAPAGDSSMLSYLFDCNKIKYDISVFTGFNVGDDAMTAPTNFATFSGTYNPGCPGDTVVVRVMYPWNTSVINWPISALKTLTMNFSNMGDGTRLLMAVTAFRNEPYDARNAPPGCPTS